MSAAGFVAVNHAPIAASFLALAGGAVGLLIYRDCAHAMSQWRDAIDGYLRRNDGLCILPRSSYFGLASKAHD
jgi:hypothetical protein